MKSEGLSAKPTVELEARKQSLRLKREMSKRLSRPEERELERIEGILAQRMRLDVSDVLSGTKTPVTVETEPARQRLESALGEAREKGLIVTEEGGDLTSERVCYLMSSMHYGRHTLLDESGKKSHHELFVLLNLFEQHGVQSTLYVEGMRIGEQPKRHHTVTNPETQKHFRKHPDEFIRFMDEKAMEGNPLSFYALASFQKIYGFHAQRTWETVQTLLPLAGIETKFVQRYVTEGEGILSRVETQGTSRMIRVKGQLLSPNDIINDCDAYIQYISGLAEIDAVRERELAERFDTESDEVPMGWVGISHEKAVIAECAKRSLKVISVIPASAASFRSTFKSPVHDLLKNLPSVIHWRSVIVKACT